jgi:hypothetical protein
LTPGLTVVNGVADTDKIPADKLTAAIRTFANRALRGRRLAYALIAEPVDPEVEAVRLIHCAGASCAAPAPASTPPPASSEHSWKP